MALDEHLFHPGQLCVVVQELNQVACALAERSKNIVRFSHRFHLAVGPLLIDDAKPMTATP